MPFFAVVCGLRRGLVGPAASRAILQQRGGFLLLPEPLQQGGGFLVLPEPLQQVPLPAAVPEPFPWLVSAAFPSLLLFPSKFPFPWLVCTFGSFLSKKAWNWCQKKAPKNAQYSGSQNAIFSHGSATKSAIFPHKKKSKKHNFPHH